MAAVLLVEDDPAQRRALSLVLGRRGHEVAPAATGSAAMDAARLIPTDIALVDLGLPDVDGIELCARLKRWPGCPIIVVSAEADEARIIEALRVGADDYIVKPVSADLLEARIAVQLRHVAQRGALPTGAVLESGDVRLDPDSREVSVGGVDPELNAQQFDILAFLVRRAGHLVTYDALLAALGKPRDDVSLRALRTAVSRLRSKLGSGARRPRIHAERHVGYRLVEPVAEVDETD